MADATENVRVCRSPGLGLTLRALELEPARRLLWWWFPDGRLSGYFFRQGIYGRRRDCNRNARRRRFDGLEMKSLLFLLLVLTLAPSASAAHRSRAAVNAFKRTHPCPANGNTKGMRPPNPS